MTATPAGGRARGRTPGGAARTRALRAALLRWYRRSRRDLPWRRTRDPYAVWISESMLQQTRVETVIPYYEQFLVRFPDAATLADAPLDDVLSSWAGLGYYSRARNLHAAARAVVRDHGGRLPADAEALRALPGIGRYTAGAVASIAFDRPEPIVDGNVARVLARIHALPDDVRAPAGQRRLWEEAGRLVRGASPGDLNQALMELGATLCTPRAPRCDACPVSRHCEAHRHGIAEQLPVARPRAAPRPVSAAAVLLRRRGRVLAVRRPPRGLLGGLWELPGDDLARRERPARGAARAVRERVGLTASEMRPVGRVQHVFSHRSLTLHVFHCERVAGRVRLDGYDAHAWVRPDRLDALFGSRVSRKTLALLEEHGALG